MSKRNFPRIPDPKPHEHLKPAFDDSTQAGIDRIIHYSLKTSRDSATKSHNPAAFQGDVLKHRLDAMKRYLSEIKDKYGVTKTSTGFMTNTELWVKLNLFPFTSYSDLDDECHITLAAALWLLDRIADPYEIGEILSADYEPTDLPHFYDVSHSTDTVQAAVSAIRNRKSSPQYSQLLNLVHDIDIEVATTHFKNTMWKWVDRLFEAEEYIARAYKEPVERSMRAVDSYNASLERILQHVHAIEMQFGSKPKKQLNLALADPYGIKKSPLESAFPSQVHFMPPSLSDPTGAYLDVFRQAEPDLDNMRRCENTIQEVNDKTLAEIYEAEMKFLILSSYQGFITPRAFKGVVDVDFTPLPIDDPYELCFAFIYLLDQGDELTWLWGACDGFLHHIYRHLPWGLMEFKNKTIPMPRKNVAIPEPCAMQYENEQYSFPFSMGQIIYQMTGAILPRDMHFMDGLAPTVRKLGVKGKDVNLMIALMNVLNAVQGRTEVLATEEDEEEENLTPTEDVEELKEQLKKLREQNKKLTDVAHEQDRRARKAEAALALEREQIDSDRRELAGLREVVFANSASTSATDDDRISVVLPHKVQSRLIIFGGHDMWQKPMKEYLTGDIRFIDRSLVAFDTDVIKHADEIWIQTNCISHKMYYKIMDAARKWKKQVKYFLYASARKCAEQVVLSEDES